MSDTESVASSADDGVTQAGMSTTLPRIDNLALPEPSSHFQELELGEPPEIESSLGPEHALEDQLKLRIAWNEEQSQSLKAELNSLRETLKNEWAAKEALLSTILNKSLGGQAGEIAEYPISGATSY